MSTKEAVIRTFICLVVLGAWAAVFFFIFVISAFSNESFYTVAVIPAFIISAILTCTTAYVKLPLRRYFFMWGTYFLIMIVGVVAVEGRRAYFAAIPVIDDHLNINLYRPFTGGTLVTRMDSSASLRLTDELPRLDGATALFPLYSAFVQAVYSPEGYSGNESVLGCTTTRESYRRLVDGEVDIIFAAYPGEGQLAYAEERGVELVFIPIGREAFVFFVNSKNKVAELSTEQIKGIYSGEIINWKEVGGSSDSIRAFQRPEDSGSQSAFLRFMEETAPMVPPTYDRPSPMSGMISEVADYKNHKNAIGYSFRFYSTEMVREGRIKLLKIDGIMPNRESITSGTYPLSSYFYAVYVKGNKNPNTTKFLDWILSDEGQTLIQKVGYNSL